MSETVNVAPGWSIGPGWNLSSLSGNGSSTEYYYYINGKKRRRPALSEPEITSVLKVDWSQQATDSFNIDLQFDKVMREARRVGTLKEK